MTSRSGDGDDTEGAGIRDGAEEKKPARSFPGAIVDSASGLLRDAVTSRGSQVGTTLSQALAAGGKGGSTSGGAASASTSLQDANAYIGPSISDGSASGHENFRSIPGQSDARPEAFNGMTLDQFLKTDLHSTGNVFEDDIVSSKGKQAVYLFGAPESTSDNSDAQFAAVWDSNAGLGSAQAAGPVPIEDGEEVVKLLSDPNFQPDIWMGGDAQAEEPYTISQEEAQLSQWFVHEVQRNSSQKGRIQDAVDAARAARPYNEFATIFDDMERYHEDVWASIGPLVQAAREEQRAALEDSTGDGPAVRRLRMVMAHLNMPA